MNTQALVIRTVAAGLLGVLALVEMIHSKPVDRHETPVVAAAPAAAKTTVAPPSIVTLPTISVRPSAEEIAEAMRVDTPENDFDAVKFASGGMLPVNNRQTALPGFGVTMPYYSFGKVLHRVSKD